MGLTFWSICAVRKKADIPEAIKQTLAQDFDGYEIEEAEISEKADGSAYELAVEKGEEE